ncbi:MAG TPA: hypothetical protein PKY59_14075 [Pyrinomonadaceae bacterium]|nr:hypothetical protein [Pyrinomonadaceae bacterium]
MMKSLKLKIFISVLTFIFGISIFFVFDIVRKLPESIQEVVAGKLHSNKISLEISALKTDVKVGESVPITIFLTNNDDGVVTLVNPGDGSSYGGRTPIIQWSIIKNNETAKHPSEPQTDGIASCAFMNNIRSDEVFWLASGEKREMKNWTYLPPFEKKGTYRVVFLYANRPSLKWRNEYSLRHSRIALWRAKHSTETTIVSNEIIFNVTE